MGTRAVPPCFFTHVHGLAHAGKRVTSRLVSARFVWPGLAADVREWCRQCTSCQRAKVLVQEQAMVEKMPMASARFSHVHVDLMGPLPATKGGCTFSPWWSDLQDGQNRFP